MTWTIIATCIVVFFWQLSFSESQEEALIYALGFVPKNLFDNAEITRFYGIPWPWFTLMTSMFLHGGFLHLGGNMLYLWIFGNNVEDAMGHVRFLAFYFVCGIVAALSEGLVNPHSGLPMLGASGAISGVLAAYVLIYPRTRITVIIPLGILLYPTKISAFYVVGFWFLLQLLNVVGTTAGGPGTAWWAHVGGFVAGMLLTPMLSNFPLFGRYRRGPWG
ncbi:MAG TPA: rhomboid family intramembrane serine protease [Micropepsaceae bacterium]